MRCLSRCGLLGLALLGMIACQGRAQAGMDVLKSGDNYRVMTSVEAAKGGKSGKLIVVIEPTSGWKMEREKGPAGFTLEGPDAVVFKSKTFKKTDAHWEKGGKQIRFDVPYTLSAPGSYKLKIKFRFVICTDKLCQMKRFEAEYTLGS